MAKLVTQKQTKTQATSSLGFWQVTREQHPCKAVRQVLNWIKVQTRNILKGDNIVMEDVREDGNWK